MKTTKSRPTVPMFLLSLGLLLIAASGYYILQDNPSQNDSTMIPARVNYPAPKLTLTDLEGRTTSLSDFRGQVILVNLWATWCPPCKEEMPALEAYYARHKAEGFIVIAINDGDPPSDVIQFVEDYNLSFPVWLDPTYIATEQAFKTLNLPSSFVIDRSGTVGLQWVGGIDRRALERFVTPIIKETQ